MSVVSPSDEEHVAQCELAGCGHPAVYEFEDGTTVQGWCVLCRAVAVGIVGDEIAT